MKRPFENITIGIIDDVISAFDDSQSSQESISKSKQDRKIVKQIDQEYLTNLTKKLKDTESDFVASTILIDVGNRLLLSTSERYKQIKDPLTFKKEKLKEKLIKYEVQSKIYQEFEKIKKEDEKINAEDQKLLAKLKEETQKKFNDISQELQVIETLIEERNNLHKSYKGCFSIVPRKLTPTFVTKYNRDTNQELKEIEIVEQLLDYRQKLVESADLTSVISKEVVEVLIGKDNVKFLKRDKYNAKTIEKLEKGIKEKVGKVPDKKVIAQWVKNNHLQDKDKPSDVECKKEITEKLLADYERIHMVSKSSMKYINDNDYLNMLSKEDFLVQVRAYRNLTRDVEKNTLLAGTDGESVVIHPFGTKMQIYTTGSQSIEFLPLQGKYTDLANYYLETLKAYEQFHKGDFKGVTIEREQEYKSLFQIEAIRSSSALLTNCMFFELAKASFCNEYSFELACKQMPMAMTGAVLASIVLEHQLQDNLTNRLPYDYREISNKDVNKSNYKDFNARNKKILSDWLSFKLEADDEVKEFPALLLQQLINEWYNRELPLVEKDFMLRAAAEPKDPDINRDQDEATAILLKNTEQSDDNFNIDQKVNNKIAEELTKSTQNLNINDLIGEAQAFNNVIDLTLLNTPLELLGFCSELIVM